MAKHIIRYLLDGDGSIPKFVEEGGHFLVGEELVGRSVDDTKRFLPVSVFKLTRAALIARVQTCYKNEDNSFYTEQQATDVVTQFLTSVGLPDYA